MGTLRSRKALFGACAIFIGSLSVAQLAGWAPLDRLVELAALILAAILTSVLAPAAKSRVIMPPSFVVIFGSLLLFDRNIATLVALAAVLSPVLANTGRSVQWARLSIDALIEIGATQLGGVTYEWLDGFSGGVWPWHAVPIAASVVVYHLVQRALAEVIVPLFSRQP